MGYELLIALRYLRPRRRSAFISITTLFTALGVMIGVAALTITLAVMNGFEANLRERVLSLSPQIQILSFEGAVANYREVAAKAATMKGVAGADPFLVGQAMLSASHGATGVIVRGIEPDNPVANIDLRRYIDGGRLASLDQSFPVPDEQHPEAPIAAIAIGHGLAEKLQVGVGGKVRITSPILSATGGQITAISGVFIVGAEFDSGVMFIDRTVVFMGLSQAQKFFGRQDRADGIEVRLHNLDDTVRVTKQLREVFPYPFRVRNWMDFNQAASAGFAMLKLVYSAVLVMLIGVAAFNLIATLIMVVMEKRKDIAILMAMGATGSGVRRIFILKGLLVGCVGTAAGLALGALGCFLLARYQFVTIPKEIYGISALPVAATPGSFVLVAAASIALCLLAAFYPARQASRQLPVEIIRWE